MLKAKSTNRYTNIGKIKVGSCIIIFNDIVFVRGKKNQITRTFVEREGDVEIIFYNNIVAYLCFVVFIILYTNESPRKDTGSTGCIETASDVLTEDDNIIL